MKILILAGAALLAAPAIAQQTPAAPAEQTMPAPAAGTGIPNTPLSDSTAPATGARAAEGDAATNNAAATTPGVANPGTTTVTTSAGNTITFAPPVTDTPPAPKASYPVCKRGQFDGCTEPHQHK